MTALVTQLKRDLAALQAELSTARAGKDAAEMAVAVLTADRDALDASLAETTKALAALDASAQKAASDMAAELGATVQRLGAADRIIADLRRDLAALAAEAAEARKARAAAEAQSGKLKARLSKAETETAAAIAAGKVTRSAQADRLRKALHEANRRLAQYGGSQVEVP
ncbi:MAG: hypothetical protein CMK96_06165 [Pseudomonas sp.]|nr:hypothetical protein [Pseudomonas sp.]QDP67236.1 MAG: hypothetical protein GOVbin7368_27 [Prokaryotic dsDNA virus sp.]|tara:strand:+ start:26835 stop:27341 length:507 start_codon:yes stop_codon:yes gene_type:complete